MATIASRAAYYGGLFYAQMRPRFWLANRVCGLLPDFVSGVLRARLYRRCGIQIGPGAFIMGNLTIKTGEPNFQEKLTIGANVTISTDVTLNLDAPIAIEENVTIGPFVRIYTGTHEIGPSSQRCQPPVTMKPVVIERGCWVAMGVMILPGVRIGRGSVIAAGAVIAHDIPPNSFVTGLPGRPIKTLPDGAGHRLSEELDQPAGADTTGRG